MSHKPVLLLACLALGGLLPGLAWADGAYDIGLSGAYAMPMGDARAGTSMANLASGAVTAEVSGVYRITHRIRVGLAGSYGPALRGSDAANARTATQWRSQVGLLGEYHWAPFASQDPWLGVLLAYDQLEQNYAMEGLGQIVKNAITWKSPISLDLRGGYQFQLSPDFYVGPYLGATLEHYSEVLSSPTAQTLASTDQTWHVWLAGGLTVRYGL